jgi:hypothetical protein
MKFSKLDFIKASTKTKEELMILLTIRELVFKKMKEPTPLFPDAEDLLSNLSAPYNEMKNLNPILLRLLAQQDILKNLVVTMQGAEKIKSFLQKKGKSENSSVDEVYLPKPVLVRYKNQNVSDDDAGNGTNQKSRQVRLARKV